MTMLTNMPLALGMPGHWEILIIVGVLVLLFGAKQLPTIARSFGKSLASFKKGKLEAERELREFKSDLDDVTGTIKKDVEQATKI